MKDPLTPAQALGLSIESEMVLACVSREEAARHLGIAYNTFCRYLTGESEPNLARLRQIAALIGVMPQQLLDRADVAMGRMAPQGGVSQANEDGANVQVVGHVSGDLTVANANEGEAEVSPQEG